MSLGPWQLAIIALLILVLFGKGKLSEMMGDFGKGIKSFKKGMNEEENSSQTSGAPSAQIEAPSADASVQSSGVQTSGQPSGQSSGGQSAEVKTDADTGNSR